MASTEYTVENLTAMKTVELRKLAGSIGIKGMSSARKGDLIPAIIASAAKAERTENGTVKGKLCAECGEKPVDRKTQGADSTMCDDCFEYAGWENTHSDEDHQGTDNLALREGCPVCKKAGLSSERPAVEISAKALRFEADAKAAGWSALARNGFNGTSLVTATSPDGQTLELHWAGKIYVYDKSKYVASGATKGRKIRNASAARKILAGS
jgi:hypothetical protein